MMGETKHRNLLSDKSYRSSCCPTATIIQPIMYYQSQPFEQAETVVNAWPNAATTLLMLEVIVLSSSVRTQSVVVLPQPSSWKFGLNKGDLVSFLASLRYSSSSDLIQRLLLPSSGEEKSLGQVLAAAAIIPLLSKLSPLMKQSSVAGSPG